MENIKCYVHNKQYAQLEISDRIFVLITPGELEWLADNSAHLRMIANEVRLLRNDECPDTQVSRR
jgi:hypothetical protein